MQSNVCSLFLTVMEATNPSNTLYVAKVVSLIYPWFNFYITLSLYDNKIKGIKIEAQQIQNKMSWRNPGDGFISWMESTLI